MSLRLLTTAAFAAASVAAADVAYAVYAANCVVLETACTVAIEFELGVCYVNADGETSFKVTHADDYAAAHYVVEFDDAVCGVESVTSVFGAQQDTCVGSTNLPMNQGNELEVAITSENYDDYDCADFLSVDSLYNTTAEAEGDDDALDVDLLNSVAVNGDFDVTLGGGECYSLYSAIDVDTSVSARVIDVTLQTITGDLQYVFYSSFSSSGLDVNDACESTTGDYADPIGAAPTTLCNDGGNFPANLYVLYCADASGCTFSGSVSSSVEAEDDTCGGGGGWSWLDDDSVESLAAGIIVVIVFAVLIVVGAGVAAAVRFGVLTLPRPWSRMAETSPTGTGTGTGTVTATEMSPKV